MTTDLAGTIDGIAERFVPEEMHGHLVEAEHLSRYWWVAPLTSGKRVLDAGCGTAYGSAILAAGGANEVVGVDRANEVLAAVRPRMPERVQLQCADVANLPFESNSFDIVVCFEVIEHVEDTDRVLDELARVVRDDGVLVISSPNRDVFMSGNPHHRREFVPAELKTALDQRFENVRLYRQADWITAAVLNDELHAHEGDQPLTGVEVRKIVGGRPGEELYSLALAGNRELPEPAGSATITSAAEIKNLVETSLRLTDEDSRMNRERQEFMLRAAQAVSAESEAREETKALTERLLALETQLARAHQTVARRDDELQTTQARIDQLELDRRTLEDELAAANRAIGEMQQSRLWRLGSSYWRLRNRLLRL